MKRSTLPQMLQCVNPSGTCCPDMTVLKWQNQQQGICDDFFGSGMTSQCLIVADVANNNPVKLDPGVYNEWHDFGVFGGNCGDMGLLEANYGMAPKVECVMADQKSSQESMRKRKVDKLSIIKTEVENEVKKIKGLCTEETVQSNNNCKKNKENVRNSEVKKQDYIHVRARRGQATDSHSLAERVRREKISERMKFLQDLVPGCNNITGKAGMLDEIINYVQSLQRQVEFLSMKLAGVNPSLDIDIESLFAKQISPALGSSELTNQGYIHYDPASQVVSCVGMELGVNPDLGLWRTISAPLPATEKFLEASSFTQQMQDPSGTTWDDISQQNLYNIV